MLESTFASKMGIVGLIAAAAVGTAWYALPEGFPALRPNRPGTEQVAAARSPSMAPPSLAAPQPSSPASLRALLPRFDVARVGARGMLVTAGRAAAGAEVALLEGQRELGRARADGRGEWVILPSDALAPGARELSLVARLQSGETVAGEETVLLVVPEPPGGGAFASVGVNQGSGAPGGTGSGAGGSAATSGPLAMLLPSASAPNAAPRVLQGAGGAAGEQPTTAANGGAARQRLGLDVIDYDDAGSMRFAGSAAPGASVRVYAGPQLLGEATADTAGRWHLTPDDQPNVGRHVLRLDQMALAGGSVAARIEVPFQRDRLPESAVQDGRMVVQPGQNLWRIARHTYGRGMRYTVIYAANRDTIRDPSLIYPGQVFALPEDKQQSAGSVGQR
ncbi:LysM peptidoglycan-binding domain-containing protein [Craurococcus roseus]